jgi:hypothetical protein
MTFVMPHDNMTLLPVFADMTSAYKLDFATTDAGNIPQGWRCVQENNDVHQYPNSYSQGARTFAGFTGYQGKALYWRNDCAEYGRQNANLLTLQPGDYKLTYAMAAWKESPKYKVQILNATTGSAIAAGNVLTATPNANGTTAANLTSAQEHTLEFSVQQQGNYIISFHDETSGSGYHEFLLLECLLNNVGSNAIESPWEASSVYTFYDLNGRRANTQGKGIYIMRAPDGKVRKVLR